VKLLKANITDTCENYSTRHWNLYCESYSMV